MTMERLLYRQQRSRILVQLVTIRKDLVLLQDDGAAARQRRYVIEKMQDHLLLLRRDFQKGSRHA